MSRNHVRIARRDWKRWALTRLAVFKRDRYRCRQCGKAGRLECDHVTPLQAGGAEWAMRNLQTLCRAHHIEKTNRERLAKLPPDVLAWRAYLRGDLA